MKENIEEEWRDIKQRIEDVKEYLEYGLPYSEYLDLENSFEHILSDYKRVLKENEELNNRCRNLDKEAQAYLEELAGDNTLTSRTIKQLQEENKELKADNLEYQRTQDIFDERTYRKKYLEERRAEQPNLLYPDADEIYERYYKLKNDLLDSVPKQKIKDKIEELIKNNTEDNESVKRFEEMRRNLAPNNDFYTKSYQTSIHKLNAQIETRKYIINNLQKLLESEDK